MNMNRRDLLAGLGSAAAIGLGSAPLGPALAEPPPRRRALRLAFITDVHLTPEGPAVQGFTACLHHLQSLRDRPDAIFCGGDAIMDCFAADYAQTKRQWELWQKVIKAECSLPMECCIGNHDIWGGNREKSGTTGAEALYGRKWAMDVFGMASPYRSFDRAGWHFVFVDSTRILGDGAGDPAKLNYGYAGQLEADQLEWLKDELDKVPSQTPIAVVSHIPIVSVAAFFTGATGNEQLVREGNYLVPGSWMHLEARELKDLFAGHPNVKLCLSGHLHLEGRSHYNGVGYLCNGAVCGAWWKGPLRECKEGYAVVDLFADGGFQSQYLSYV